MTEARQAGTPRQVVAAVIVRDGRVLICQRTIHQALPLKWEFAGGKIEAGETPEAALKRELQEESVSPPKLDAGWQACAIAITRTANSNCTSSLSSGTPATQSI